MHRSINRTHAQMTRQQRTTRPVFHWPPSSPAPCPPSIALLPRRRLCLSTFEFGQSLLRPFLQCQGFSSDHSSEQRAVYRTSLASAIDEIRQLTVPTQTEHTTAGSEVEVSRVKGVGSERRGAVTLTTSAASAHHMTRQNAHCQYSMVAMRGWQRDTMG